MNKKAVELTFGTIAVAILVIFVVGGLLLWFSGAFGSAKASVGSLTPSEESIWSQRCNNACENAKMQSKDCNTDWQNLYCKQKYNDTATCNNVEDWGVISKCKHKINNMDCGC